MLGVEPEFEGGDGGELRAHHPQEGLWDFDRARGLLLVLRPLRRPSPFLRARRNYAANKKAAVAAVHRLLNLTERQKMIAACNNKKADDVCDAILYCLYALPRYDALVLGARVLSEQEQRRRKAEARALAVLERKRKRAAALEASTPPPPPTKTTPPCRLCLRPPGLELETPPRKKAQRTTRGRQRTRGNAAGRAEGRVGTPPSPLCVLPPPPRKKAQRTPRGRQRTPKAGRAGGRVGTEFV